MKSNVNSTAVVAKSSYIYIYIAHGITLIHKCNHTVWSVFISGRYIYIYGIDLKNKVCSAFASWFNDWWANTWAGVYFSPTTERIIKHGRWAAQNAQLQPGELAEGLFVPVINYAVKTLPPTLITHVKKNKRATSGVTDSYETSGHIMRKLNTTPSSSCLLSYFSITPFFPLQGKKKEFRRVLDLGWPACKAGQVRETGCFCILIAGECFMLGNQ